MIITDWMLERPYWEGLCNELVMLINRHPNRNARVELDESRIHIRVEDEAVPIVDGQRRIIDWKRA